MDRILSCELVNMVTYRVYKPWLFEGLMLQVISMHTKLACMLLYSNKTHGYAKVNVNENHGDYEYLWV